MPHQITNLQELLTPKQQRLEWEFRITIVKTSQESLTALY